MDSIVTDTKIEPTFDDCLKPANYFTIRTPSMTCGNRTSDWREEGQENEWAWEGMHEILGRYQIPPAFWRLSNILERYILKSYTTHVCPFGLRYIVCKFTPGIPRLILFLRQNHNLNTIFRSWARLSPLRGNIGMLLAYVFKRLIRQNNDNRSCII